MAETIAPDMVLTLIDQHRRFRDFLERRVGSRAVAEELLQSAFVNTSSAATSFATTRVRWPGSTDCCGTR